MLTVLKGSKEKDLLEKEATKIGFTSIGPACYVPSKKCLLMGERDAQNDSCRARVLGVNSDSNKLIGRSPFEPWPFAINI